MMPPVSPLPAAVLLLIALGAVATLLVLILRYRVHAFVALVLVSLGTAWATRIPMNAVVPTLLEGLGGTLAAVALLVGFGAMIGRILEATGGAQVLADRLIRLFGEQRAPLALGLASLLFGLPIFFDAGLVVMLPIIFSVARRMGGSVLTYALPATGALAVMHAFLPPHPGPVAAGDLLGADLGLLTLVGLGVALPTWFLGGYVFGLWTGRRVFQPIPVLREPVGAASSTAPPSLATVLAVLLLPLVLIAGNTGASALATVGVLSREEAWVTFFLMIGQTPVALLITLLVAIVTLGARGRSRSQLHELLDRSLAPVCAVILVTGAGGMFGGVLRASGIGAALSNGLDQIGLPIIAAAFVIAASLRVAQGSATVALTTTAGLMAPAVAATPGLSPLDRCFVVIAIACGSTVLSHVNDSGFWLVSRFLEMDELATLKTWTVMVTLLGCIGFAFAVAGSVVL